jgi:hypothetical protein
MLRGWVNLVLVERDQPFKRVSHERKLEAIANLPRHVGSMHGVDIVADMHVAVVFVARVADASHEGGLDRSARDLGNRDISESLPVKHKIVSWNIVTVRNEISRTQ